MVYDMDDANPHSGHRQRLRERFQRAGILALNDYERLEMLLAYALPRRDTKPIAKALLARHGSLAGVLDADPTDLAGVPGMGETSAVMLHLVRELCHQYFADRLADVPAAVPQTGKAASAASSTLPTPSLAAFQYPSGNGGFAETADTAAIPPSPASAISPVARLATHDTVLDYVRVKLGGAAHEMLLVIFLDAAHRVLDHQIMQEGVHDRVAVYPRRIVETALARRAVGVILVHNHPSGVARPSRDDLAMTHAVAQAAALLDIRLVDHLIVAGGGVYSFAGQGML